MRPVDQTTFGQPGGNCFSACVASLLHLTIGDVPYFMGASDWVEEFANWLSPRWLYPVTIRCQSGDWRPRGFYILGGESPRGSHAVVALHGRIVHDPHPSRDGLIRIEDATMLVPFEPHHVVGSVGAKVSGPYPYPREGSDAKPG